MKNSYLNLAGVIGVIGVTSAVIASPSLAGELTTSKTTKLEAEKISAPVASDIKVKSQPSLETVKISQNPAVQSVSQSAEVKVSQVVTPDDSLAQNVTSVSQLSDVRPTDWAFTALQSLVERYGCIAGYPDRTYRGQRALSRFEFAAGLNACLDKINEIISAGLADKVSKEDLAALQKLQEEFAAELATLRGRVDALEAKTAKLEAQQFSTTTKLEGQVVIAVNGGSSGNSFLNQPGLNALGGSIATTNPGKSNVTLLSRVRLNFNTSFNGDDLLITRLQATTGTGANNYGALLFQPGSFAAGNVGFSGAGLDFGGGSSGAFSLNKLTYEFGSRDLRLTLIAQGNAFDYVDTNSFANNEAVDFNSSFFINNPFHTVVIAGQGAFLSWNPNNSAFTARLLYIANAGASATPGVAASTGIFSNRGLSGDPYQATAEVEFAPRTSDGTKGPFAIRLQYTNASTGNVTFNTGGVNLEWAFSKYAAIFGRYGFGTIDGRGVLASTNPGLSGLVNAAYTGSNLSPQTWSVGFAFPDLFKKGALAGIAVGQPFIESNVGNASQTNLELFYNFPISDHIRITPDVQFVFNPNNNSSNSTVTIGTLRTVFSF
ncbi:iron uptake porin [Tumidithrix elongata RA019]|uniref:Iron uptake porin n=1 Tax=Tumidithrix elongata BACA0141 TaxID=2716417 RepID=A0AAW9Q0Y7_9CYAN|nr:iron uptake porin [Tumidithrix elongata RA019]